MKRARARNHRIMTTSTATVHAYRFSWLNAECEDYVAYVWAHSVDEARTIGKMRLLSERMVGADALKRQRRCDGDVVKDILVAMAGYVEERCPFGDGGPKFGGLSCRFYANDKRDVRWSTPVAYLAHKLFDEDGGGSVVCLPPDCGGMIMLTLYQG